MNVYKISYTKGGQAEARKFTSKNKIKYGTNNNQL